MLIDLGKPELALAHLQKAVSLNPRSEVAYYQLAQCRRALGDEAGQGKALAVFQRLQAERNQQTDFIPSRPGGGDEAGARPQAARTLNERS